MSTAPPVGPVGKGTPETPCLGLVAASYYLIRGVRIPPWAGILPWAGIPGEARRAPRWVSELPAAAKAAIALMPQPFPLRKPSGERDAQSLRSIQRGRPFGELGSILSGQPRVQGRDPPAFSARNAGESLTAHSSIRPRRALAQWFGVLATKALSECSDLFNEILSSPLGPESSTSFVQSVGQGYRIG